MSGIPARDALEATLTAAGSAHHEFETRYLSGVRDALWPGFYAAYALGRLGDFAKPTELARWLEEVKNPRGWAAAAAAHVAARLAERR